VTETLKKGFSKKKKKSNKKEERKVELFGVRG
jgi:hypothetical protein